MTPFGRAFEYQLRNVVADLLAALDGIPEDAFNAWKPAAARDGGHELNTFAALAIHAVSAGEYMTLHAVGGQPSQRVREAEFEATGSLVELVARYDRWLDGVHALMADFTDADLDRPSFSARYTERNWRAAEILLHALDHTALHAGHVQVQRQLWETEQGW